MGECKTAVYVRNSTAPAEDFESQVKSAEQIAADLGHQAAPHAAYSEGDMQKLFESHTDITGGDTGLQDVIASPKE